MHTCKSSGQLYQKVTLMYSNMDVRFSVLVLCVTLTGTWSYKENQCVGVGGYFRYTITNLIQPPLFNNSMMLKICPCTSAPFIRYMEDSVMLNPTNFTSFTGTFTNPFGYLIDSINGVAGDWKAKKTYWQISNSSGPLDVGVSSYIPSPGDNMVFNLIKDCPKSNEKLLYGDANGKC